MHCTRDEETTQGPISVLRADLLQTDPTQWHGNETAGSQEHENILRPSAGLPVEQVWQQRVVEQHLTGNNGGGDSHNKHGPVDRGGNAGVERGPIVVGVDHQVGCLPQVGDDEGGVGHAQEAQLQSNITWLRVDSHALCIQKLSCSSQSSQRRVSLGVST